MGVPSCLLPSPDDTEGAAPASSSGNRKREKGEKGASGRASAVERKDSVVCVVEEDLSKEPADLGTDEVRA